MKPFTLAATLSALALAPLAADAADRIVVLSDTMPKENARTVLAQSKYIMSQLQPGDTLTFLNGPEGREIARLDLSDTQTAEDILSSKRKTNQFFSGALQSVQDFAVSAAKKAEKLDADAVPMQVNLPGVLHNLTIHASKTPDVLVFGSLRYHDPRLPAYSMAHSFPNDAHVFYTPSETPFGAAGRDGQLEGTRVHFCDLDQGYVKEMQRLGLERATGLLVQGYGATFANATSDVAQCVRSGLAGHVDATKSYTPDQSDRTVRIYNALHTGQMPASTSQEQNALFNRLDLPQDQKAELANLMSQKRVMLAEVYLYDTASSDGDVVALISGKVRFDVPLTHKKTRVVVPITDGKLVMQGVHDGGGGITVGLRTQDGDELTSPVMRVGQTVEVPFVSSL
jgi:hypothetical protein